MLEYRAYLTGRFGQIMDRVDLFALMTKPPKSASSRCWTAARSSYGTKAGGSRRSSQRLKGLSCWPPLSLQTRPGAVSINGVRA